MKASEMKRLLGDVSNADEIIAKGIADGSLENDLGAAPIVKSDVVAQLAAQVKAEIDRLNLVKSEAPAREASSEKLQKSEAAKASPEFAEAIGAISAVITDTEKNTVETLSALAKGTSAGLEATNVLLKGFADLATRFVSLQEKVETLSKAAETAVVEPKGVAAAAQDAQTIPVASPHENAEAAAGAVDPEAFFKSAMEATELIKGAIVNLSAEERAGARGKALRDASTQLSFGVCKDPEALVKSLGLK